MKYTRILKAGIWTYDELNKFTEEKLREKGFPSDEQLQKEYKEYISSEEILPLLETKTINKPTFEEYKKQKLIEFSDKLYKETPKQTKKWELDDGWEETDEEPITELED